MHSTIFISINFKNEHIPKNTPFLFLSAFIQLLLMIELLTLMPEIEIKYT